MLSGDPSDRAMMLVRYLADQHQAIENWDDVLFAEYAKAVVEDRGGEILKTEGAKIHFLAFIEAIKLVTQSIEKVRDELNLGKGRMEGDLFLIDDIRNPIFTMNVEDFEEIKLKSYEALTAFYNESIQRPFSDKELFIKTEIGEFSRLFMNHESFKGWEYLSERLNESIAEIEELYENRGEIISGSYVHSLLEEGDDRRIIFGKLFAAKKYIEFLNQRLKNLNSKEKEGILLPDLLLNPENIHIMDKWLLESGFIKEENPGAKFPYKWIGKRNNEELGILSTVNESSVDNSEAKKIRPFSLPYQISAFGFWLFECGKLKMDTYVSTTLARAVLEYYNIDDPTNTFTDAFKDSKKKKAVDYMYNYLPLGKLLKANTRSTT
jgi:hypothetical protein